MKTRRQRMEEMLREGPMRPSHLAKVLEVPLSTVLEDLEHLWRKHRNRLMVRPAVCRKCGYRFSPSLRVPKRCPQCDSEWIDEPEFWLVE